MNYRQRQRQRQNAKQFAGTIEVPASGVLTLPAAGRMTLVATGSVVAGEDAITVASSNPRVVKSRALEDGEQQPVGWFEKDQILTINTNLDLELQLDVGLGRLRTVLR